MFLLPSHFTDPPYKIPNQEEWAGGGVGFKNWIVSRETELLKKLLGLELYNEFIDGLDTSGDIDEIWVRLKDGAVYEYGEIQYESPSMIDLLRPAVYSLWLPLNYRKATSAGIIINQGQENTQTQVPDYEIVTSWNEYVKMAGGRYGEQNTLYGILVTYSDDYESLNFCAPKFKNQFDL